MYTFCVDPGVEMYLLVNTLTLSTTPYGSAEQLYVAVGKLVSEECKKTVHDALRTQITHLINLVKSVAGENASCIVVEEPKKVTEADTLEKPKEQPVKEAFKDPFSTTLKGQWFNETRTKKSGPEVALHKVDPTKKTDPEACNTTFGTSLSDLGELKESILADAQPATYESFGHDLMGNPFPSTATIEVKANGDLRESLRIPATPFKSPYSEPTNVLAPTDLLPKKDETELISRVIEEVLPKQDFDFETTARGAAYNGMLESLLPKSDTKRIPIGAPVDADKSPPITLASYDKAFEILEGDSRVFSYEKYKKCEDMSKEYNFKHTEETKKKLDTLLKWFKAKYCIEVPRSQGYQRWDNPAQYWSLLTQQVDIDAYVTPEELDMKLLLIDAIRLWPKKALQPGSSAFCNDRFSFIMNWENPKTKRFNAYCEYLKNLEKILPSPESYMEKFSYESKYQVGVELITRTILLGNSESLQEPLQEWIRYLVKHTTYSWSSAFTKSSDLEANLRNKLLAIFLNNSPISDKILSTFTTPFFSKTMAKKLPEYSKVRKGAEFFYSAISLEQMIPDTKVVESYEVVKEEEQDDFVPVPSSNTVETLAECNNWQRI